MLIRKTIACGIMTALLMGTTLTAQAMEMPDLSACTNEEVVALLDYVQGEIAGRKIERTATLEKGNNIGGKDIPAGDYVLRKEANDGDSGIIYLRILKQQDGEVTAFNEKLWCGLLDYSTAYADGRLTFTFKNGSTFEG